MTNKSTFSGLEDMLFYTITEGADKVPVSNFIAVSSLIYIHTESYTILFFFLNFFALAVVKVCKLNITVYGQQLELPHTLTQMHVMGSVTINTLICSL